MSTRDAPIFRDRDDAGRRLGERLSALTFRDPIVLALPRGGVPVAARVAAALDAPLEVFVARKVGAPSHPEFGIGAIAEGSDEVVVTSAADRLGLGSDDLEALVDDERAELARRVDRYRGAAPLPDLEARDVILVDDGLATGVTAEAALRSLRGFRPHRLLLATPVCSPDSAERLAAIADDVVCAAAPEDLFSIGAYYDDFSQTTDDEVVDLLASSRDRSATTGDSPASERPVTVAVPGGGTIDAALTVPASARGVVLFAHGSGSSRHSPRNRQVARALQRRGLATMLTDLLTQDEEREDLATGRHRFDIGLLSLRLELASRWLAAEPSTAGLPLAYFGASTGAAAALVAAAASSGRVRAVVSRGGRPDLAGDALADVDAPTLLIVGGRDEAVIGLNQDALLAMRTVREIAIVPGATHLFEEPGALDDVARLAGDWFITHLGRPAGDAPVHDVRR
ncbi:phosphoribosyltransferase [Jiangella aurantiaca]|uniref:Phosphoribosyltransferase n=1 Tax=Jiangella aurantiaca TaxID=2530373 RepID=A0A4R5ABU2_9ACTN|nr:phosphoribosyltransferase family protein [Jiangella aurantiaca]TDD69853.1 phosphoribosyltransferase [Jiangella aurantiaca]